MLAEYVSAPEKRHRQRNVPVWYQYPQILQSGKSVDSNHESNLSSSSWNRSEAFTHSFSRSETVSRLFVTAILIAVSIVHVGNKAAAFCDDTHARFGGHSVVVTTVFLLK